MVKVSIIGATGYTGLELVRLLSQHPQMKIVGLGSQSYVNKPFSEVYPHFCKVLELPCRDIEDPFLWEQADVVFLALPHGHSVSLAQKALKAGKKVVDLGADFRLTSPQVYTQWYKTAGATQEQLDQAVYGLPEIKRADIKAARLVANPGCYPTTIILALAPLLKEGLIDLQQIIADSKSGVSGAGRGLSPTSHYSEANEDFKAYGLPHHRHLPEIEQELSVLAGKNVMLTFTPHLLPQTRGMLSTIYTTPLKPLGQEMLRELYHNFYQHEPFVRLLPQGVWPHTKWVLGTNYCDLGLSLDSRTGRLTIISAIDNLVKGASGQAIQNMNLMCGLEEHMGLTRVALYP